MAFMYKINRKDIQKHLKKRLDSMRYRHSVSVSYISGSLAMAYNQDVEKAMLAGLLHDYAKNIPIEDQIDYCFKHNIILSEYEMKNKCIIHGKVGASMVMEQFHIKDEEILMAIFNHVCGRDDMGIIEKIVFVSDYIEPERKPLPRIEEIRKWAYVDIDRAVMMIYENIILYIRSQGYEIDESTKIAYDFYRRKYE